MDNPTRTCEDCGADISDLHWRAKRCQACGGRSKQPRTVACAECGTSFTNTTGKATYCTVACLERAGHRRRNPHVVKRDERVCVDCGACIAERGSRAQRCEPCAAEAVRSRKTDQRPPVRIPRVCVICEGPFVAKRRDSLCCSRRCTVARINAVHNAKRYIRHEPRPCPACGTDFTPKRKDQIACSRLCYQRLTRSHEPIWHNKTCDYCRKPFTSKRSDALRCSQKCTKAYHYEVYGEAVRAAVAAWRAANPERCRINAARYKARRKGWEGDGPGVSLGDWTRLVARHEHRCAYCQDKPDLLHMDHVVPLSRGGQHAIGNVLPACQDCNLSKGAKLLVEWRKGVMPCGRRT